MNFLKENGYSDYLIVKYLADKVDLYLGVATVPKKYIFVRLLLGGNAVSDPLGQRLQEVVNNAFQAVHMRILCFSFQ